jgi:GH25 family lysozyme M1 (1,4-beta-N-acetylmuramidase)
MTTNGGDIWEGNTLTNVDLACSFYKFMYVRTWGGNMSAGKEKDVLFDINWNKLKGKTARGTYFEVQPAWTPEQNVERFKRNYPASDPGEIPELIVYEIEQELKSKQKMIDESVLIFNQLKSFLGHTPWIYTGRWYWDPVFGEISLVNETEFIIASYYWSDDWARARKISSYSDVEQLIPPGWVLPVLGDSDRPVGYQWSGDQLKVPGITGYMDNNLCSLTLEEMKARRSGDISVIAVPDPIQIEVPAYIGLCDGIHALNVTFISQLGSGADEFNNDCEMASVSMLINAYTQQNVSVDELYARISPGSDRYLTVAEGQNALSWYGINTVRSYDLSREFLWAKMQEKKPFIALINYKPIVDAGLADTGVTFTGFHFIVVVGLDADGVLIHDPLFHRDDGGFRHIPYDVYNKAVRTSGAGILIVPSKSLGELTQSSFIKYRVDVAERYFRTVPDSSSKTTIVGKKLKGDIVSISSQSGSWGKLTDTEYWIYMPGLTRLS